MKTLTRRSREAGVNPKTAQGRRARGWPDNELFVPPQPFNHGNKRSRPNAASHPWKRTKVGK